MIREYCLVVETPEPKRFCWRGEIKAPDSPWEFVDRLRVRCRQCATEPEAAEVFLRSLHLSNPKTYLWVDEKDPINGVFKILREFRGFPGAYDREQPVSENVQHMNADEEPERIILHNSREESFTPVPGGMNSAPIGDAKGIEMVRFSDVVKTAVGKYNYRYDADASPPSNPTPPKWDTKMLNSWDWQKDCPRVQAVERREVIVCVAEERVWYLFEKFVLGQHSGWFHAYAPENPGIPEDVRVVSVHHDYSRRCFCFTLAHPSFDPVPHGEPAPILSQKWNWKAVGVDKAKEKSVLVFNYPEGDELARKAAQENASRIRGRIAVVIPRPPGGDWPAVEELTEQDVAAYDLPE